MNSISLKLVLILLGLYGIYLGLDFGLGGIETLGWQGSTDFLRVTDEAQYGVQDSNFRFFGGMLVATGIFIILAVTNLPKYEARLKLVFIFIFMGGLMRFTAGDSDVILSSSIVAALVFELGLMIVLYIWLTRTVKSLQN